MKRLFPFSALLFPMASCFNDVGVPPTGTTSPDDEASPVAVSTFSPDDHLSPSGWF